MISKLYVFILIELKNKREAIHKMLLAFGIRDKDSRDVVQGIERAENLDKFQEKMPMNGTHYGYQRYSNFQTVAFRSNSPAGQRMMTSQYTRLFDMIFDQMSSYLLHIANIPRQRLQVVLVDIESPATGPLQGFDPCLDCSHAMQIGPLINEAALEKINLQVQDALSKGAQLIFGGKRLTENGLDRGYFYAPTILHNVSQDMRIYREETFGPVAPIIVYDDRNDLLTMANDTTYGLAAYLYTRDLRKALTMFEGLNFGIIGINDINPTSAAAPFGGMKESGLGREGAAEGLNEYLETKLGGFSI